VLVAFGCKVTEMTDFVVCFAVAGRPTSESCIMMSLRALSPAGWLSMLLSIFCAMHTLQAPDAANFAQGKGKEQEA